MGEMCCADNDPIAIESRLVWDVKQRIKEGNFVWTPWTGECYCPEDELGPCRCTCKCDPLVRNNQCYCTCVGCMCPTVVRVDNAGNVIDMSDSEYGG